ncbi:MAG: DUF5330 domain-containing protein [Rhodomicrobium sp.]|nr:DUF5330 domain-containing protein [Rhodomicrobium sp.]
MSFVKAAFIVLLILLLLPTNGQERYALYTAAQRTAADIGGFCTRNPDVCDMVKSAFVNIGHKIKRTTESIEEMIHESGIGADPGRLYERQPAYRQQQGSAPSDPKTATTSSLSRDTLTMQDREPVWRGPGKI